jgi:NCS1 family nucleobase:cation symporter-1
LVRRGYYSLKDLYSARKGSPYYFHFGVSWRAYAAYICGILINVVGFADAVGTKVCCPEWLPPARMSRLNHEMF